MTIRDQIAQEKRRFAICSLPGYAIFALSFLDQGKHMWVTIISLIGFAVAFISIAWSILGIRCPKCRGRFGQLINATGGFFSVLPKLKCCPYCGTDFATRV